MHLNGTFNNKCNAVFRLNCLTKLQSSPSNYIPQLDLSALKAFCVSTSRFIL